MHSLQQLISGQLSGSTRLRISAGLTGFPPEIFTLADTLEILDLSQNKLSTLPDDFGRLANLKIIFFSDNAFTVFPEVISQCRHLDIIGFKANKIESIPEKALPENTRWLILTNNRLRALPAAIGRCTRMQKLMLAGNRLTELPNELANCQNLSLLRISANNLHTLPGWLWAMPRLSWLAFSGNPCQQKPPAAPAVLPAIPWQRLQLVQLLGEGASGIISKAVLKNTDTQNEPEAVAVKVFKGEVTSDGMPADEMDTCTAAGPHPNLIKVLGKISSHPLGKRGLVLQLIPPSFTNPGGPPDFATCTRDVFAGGTAFSLRRMLNILLGIASAAAHLHRQGIMHGDLYAHNILADEEGHALFSDFGAATIYTATEGMPATAPEQLEASAFGWLLDDLLQHAAEAAIRHAAFPSLQKLQRQCVHRTVAERPLFSSIINHLQQLKDTLENTQTE